MEFIDQVKILSAYNVSKFPELGPFLSKDSFKSQIVNLGRMSSQFLNEYDTSEVDILDLLLQMYLYICDPGKVNENYNKILDEGVVKFPLFEFNLTDFTQFVNRALEFVP